MLMLLVSASTTPRKFSGLGGGYCSRLTAYALEVGLNPDEAALIN